MSSKRILAWAVLLIAATFIGGFIPGFIAGAYRARDVAVPGWSGILQAFLVILATLVIFFFIGRTERERPLAYASSVWVVATIMSCANMVLGQLPLQWVAGAVISALVAACGVGIGIATRSKNGGQASRPTNDGTA